MTKNLLPRPGSRRFHAILDGDLPNFYDFRSKVARLLARFVHGAAAQDLVEYALLAAFIGVAGYIVLGALSGDISLTYDSWRGATPSLWEPADPATSGGGS